ncbi:hypothetical protein A1O1_06952 [Capronia coronata CBS 617.96]|uniref:NCS1 family nucleobase:cation symporter-1 n=1 Tax=Capronia coronata CBS 617.96 TaxID=1182541 RepID=W9Y287_9EURO|nr:uncharacterized protein A1O1_06952 [Capronia coronata CBS 617.96]EXJ83331.1 hypothetical protein A1O1_06952 [Capronia coronata CBS 617.96]
MDALRKFDNLIRVKGESDVRKVSRWMSPDILPVLPENRTFRSKDYVAYWSAGAICASFWSMGGTAIANGLNAGEAIGALLIGSVICAIVAHYCGAAGLKYHLGFPMLNRAAFGLYGSYFGVFVQCFVVFIYCGIQTYWGGLAVHVMLAAIFPSFHHMKNTIPSSSNITTQDLIGTILFFLVFLGVLLVPPYKMYNFFRVSFCAVVTTILGMFIWAMAANHGAGNLVEPAKKLSKAETFFVFLQTISILCGSFTGQSVRHSDWSRYAKTKSAPWAGIWLCCPIALTTCAMFGVFVTSAVRHMYGEIIWQPITLLLHIQDTDYSPGARAGTFFGGMGWFLSQLAINVSSNSVAAGMDLTAILPRYLNARRGGWLLACIGIVICPWNFVNSAGTFTVVLSSFGIFVSPLTGIVIADYWVVRKTNWKVGDLYVGNNTGIYWYTAGLNPRAFAAWVGIIWLSIPGFAAAINGTSYGISWDRMMQISFFIGLVGGFTFYCIFCKIWPVKGAREFEDIDWAVHGSVVMNGSEVEGDEQKRSVNSGSAGKMAPQEVVSSDVSKV